MPPKAEKGKKGGTKQLQAVAQLTAAQAVYKAACRRHGVALQKSLSQSIEEAIQTSTNIDKVSFSGPDITPGLITAALEMMASYPHVRNLGCWNCSIMNEGLLAVANFIRASGDRWWKGSKLRLLEIVADGSGKALESWPATTIAHMSGGLAVQGAGHEQPSWLLNPSTPQVTEVTLKLQQAGLQEPSYLQLSEEFRSLVRVGGGMTTTMYDALEQAQKRDQQNLQERIAAGVLTCCPAQPPPAQQAVKHTTVTQLPITEQILQALPKLEQHTSAQTNNVEALEQPSSIQHDSNHENVGQPDDDSHDTVNRSAPVLPAARNHPETRTSASQLSFTTKSFSPGRLEHPLIGKLGITANPHGQQQVKERPLFTDSTDEPGYLAGLKSPTAHHRPMTFNCDALQAFSLALGSVGHGLKQLVLDHNQLGDLGMHLLAPGLKRCSTLTHLSMSNCGLGHVAARALSTVMIPDSDALTAGKQPKLLFLNLSQNPLSGAGLEALCAGLLHCTTMKVLNLSSCSLTEDDVPALATLADSLAANPSIDNVDLSSNFFGDAGAKAFIPMLSKTKHMRKFRITACGMTREGGGLLTKLVRDNLPKKKGGRKTALKKK